MRINKMLSNKGICSRKDAARLIEDGRVKVNGVLSIPGQWVEEEDEILLDDKPLVAKEKIYIALNKPTGIVCTAAQEVKDNIISYMDYEDYIFPVGRLDKESQGLLILTNDGDWANEILAAENGHEKEYIVTVEREFNDEFIGLMESGVDIGDGITKACKAYRVNENTFRIILTQGLNRQIRRMCKALGHKVIKLERIRILNITLDNIEYGQWRYISKDELDTLKKLLL